MTFEQFSKYNNNFGPKYFNEVSAFPEGWRPVNVFREEIKEAWEKLAQDNLVVVAKAFNLESEGSRIFSIYLARIKESVEDPSLQELEKQLNANKAELFPLLYEAYKIMQPIVRDNELLFR